MRLQVNFEHQREEEKQVEVIEESISHWQLIVWNDDVNTFDWVITSLVEVCKHTTEQAEQCALFIHFKGKYAVKVGEYDLLQAMSEALHDRGISATVEEIDTE